ncbi:MAG: hypothetical protein RL272_486 [Candidatus Parcubacteria bacterium]
MMTDRASLRRFLLSAGAPADGADAALDVLDPFFGIAAAGRYALGRASAADVGGVARALWSAGGFHVKACVFVPSCIRHAELPWDADAERADLELRLRAIYDPMLAGTPFAGTAYAMAFDKALGDALKGALIATAGKDSAIVTERQPQQLVVYALQTYAAARAIGSPLADRLEPLAQMLEHFIPLAETGRRDGIWHVLAGC